MVVMWKHMFSMPVMRTVWRRELDCVLNAYLMNQNARWNSEKMFRSILLIFKELLNIKRAYTGCPRRNVPNFGRVFLMLNYTDINQNTYVQSWTVTEIMAREKCGLLAGPRTVAVTVLVL